MGISKTRLTMYAVLSAIELDLRNVIITYLSGREDLPAIYGADVYAKCIERSRKDGNGNAATVEDTVFYLDLGDLGPIVKHCVEYVPPDVASSINLAIGKISSLIQIRNRIAHGRPLLSTDFSKTMDTAEELTQADAYFWPATLDCLQQLKAEPAFVLSLELPEWDRDQDVIPHNLPAPDFDETGFLGRDKLVRQVQQLIEGPYPVISLIGVGGVGKTALALRVAYSMLESPDPQFDAIVWVTCKSSTLTSLEVRRIDNAIADSIGMFRKAIVEIGGEGVNAIPLKLAI